MMRFSIVIPTRNRPAQLRRCLAALERLAFPADGFEVVIVDDGSDLPLDCVVAPFRARLQITLLSQSNTGPGGARNFAAHRARGEYLAFTDDDCEPAADWLTTLSARFADRPQHLIGGRTINALPGNPCAALSQLIVDAAYAHYNTVPDQAVFFAANNMALPALLFRELGGFDATFRTAEDRDLCDRWRRSGHGMTYAPEVLLYHAHALTLGGLWRQHLEYGRGAYRFHDKRAQAGLGPFRPELRFYLRLFQSPFRTRFPGAARLVPLLLVQQAANAAGFFWELASRRLFTRGAQ